METLVIKQLADSTEAKPEPPRTFNYAHWLARFEENRLNRVEPDWQAAIRLPAEVIAPLRTSLEQFLLGDGGGPAFLIAGDREQFLSLSGDMRRLVNLWFREEREHSRLLGGLVRRFGGTPITGHWSFSIFCLSREAFGVQFELTVLLLTEIASTAYYRLLRRHTEDITVRQVCKLILRDEAGHIQFHCDRLTHEHRAHGWLWEKWFRFLGLCAATMLWVNHRRALCAVGGTRRQFYRELQIELTRFIRAVRGGGRNKTAGTPKLPSYCPRAAVR